MSATSIKPIVKTSNITIALFGGLAIGCLIVSGYWLVQGLSAVDTGLDSVMSSAGGVLLQLTEVACFLGAITAIHSTAQRKKLRAFGVFLFVLSIITIAFAQQTASIQSEKQAKKIGQTKKLMTDQVNDSQKLMDGLLQNAEKQSRSKFVASRKLGTESANRAVNIVEENRKNRERIIQENKKEEPLSPKEAFSKIIKTLGLPISPALLELLWAVFRALAVELSGVLLLTHAGTLHVNNKLLLRDKEIELQDRARNEHETSLRIAEAAACKERQELISKQEKLLAEQELAGFSNIRKNGPESDPETVFRTNSGSGSTSPENQPRKRSRNSSGAGKNETYSNHGKGKRPINAKMSAYEIGEIIAGEIDNGIRTSFGTNKLKAEERIGASKAGEVAGLLKKYSRIEQLKKGFKVTPNPGIKWGSLEREEEKPA